MSSEVKLPNITIRGIRYNQICNDSNISKYVPFKNYINRTGGCELYILESFYKKLFALDASVKMISKYYDSEEIIVTNSLPDEKPNDEAGYWVIYRAWCNAYNAEFWYGVFGELVEIIPITPDEQILLAGSTKYDSITEYDPKLLGLINRLNKAIFRLQDKAKTTELFIKTTAKSTKHDIPIKPITSAADALPYLLSSKSIQGVLERNEPVIFMLRPWNPAINSDNEIRVFIINDTIKAISQQNIYTESTILGIIIKNNADELYTKIYRTWENIKRTSKTQYIDAILDLYVTSECDVGLIEINSGGNGWGPAGSALFTWDEINSIPTGECVLAFSC